MKLSIEIPIKFVPQEDDLPMLKRDLNMSIVGAFTCNIKDEKGRTIPDPSIDAEAYAELIQAHKALSEGGSCTLVAEFDIPNQEWKVVDFK